MQIPVVVVRVKGNGYRARSAGPVAVSATGLTRDEALVKVRAKIQIKLMNGAELVGVEIGSPSPSLTEFAGMFKDDPLFNDWQKSIAAYRQEVDNDPNYR